MTGALKNLTEKVKKVANDLTSSDVVTLTGTIAITADGNPPTALNLKALHETLLSGAVKKDSDIKVVAFSHTDFDKDTVNFVDINHADYGDLLDHHRRTAESVSKARAEFVKTFKEMLSSS